MSFSLRRYCQHPLWSRLEINRNMFLFVAVHLFRYFNSFETVGLKSYSFSTLLFELIHVLNRLLGIGHLMQSKEHDKLINVKFSVIAGKHHARTWRRPTHSLVVSVQSHSRSISTIILIFTLSLIPRWLRCHRDELGWCSRWQVIRASCDNGMYHDLIIRSMPTFSFKDDKIWLHEFWRIINNNCMSFTRCQITYNSQAPLLCLVFCIPIDKDLILLH